MMRAEDLMVGNWVRVSDPEYKDDTLDHWDIYEIREGGVRLGLFSDIFEWEWLEGIPVTVDMLKRIGFEAHKGICPKTFYRYWDKEYRYKLDVDYDFCNSDRKWSIHIDNGDCNTIGCGEFTYVHELQNLVRVVSGFDLPITKEMIYG